MATVITSECINCGACEVECPNTAIYQGGVEYELNGVMHPPLSQDIFYIVPEKCTECVGFFAQEACAAVCPVDCCVPDPNIPEAEAVLLARAKTFHPDKEFPVGFPSRFRKQGAVVPPKAVPPAAATAPKIAAAPPPPPVATVAATPPPPTPAPPAAPAPAPAAAAAPVAPAPVAPAPAPKAAPKPAATPVPPAPTAATLAAEASAAAPAATRVEKPLTPPKVAVRAVKPAAPMKEKVFPDELPLSFEEALARLGTVRSDTSPRLKWFAAVSQPLSGALPSSRKKLIEEAVGDPSFFTAGGATVLNVLYNLILYPAIIVVLGALNMDRAVFSNQLSRMIVLGVVLAGLEAILRLREGVLHALPMDQAVFRGAWYGLPLALLSAPLLRRLRPVTQQGTVAVHGFQAGTFEDKLERERRYGEVYTLREQGNGFVLRLELPRLVPQSALKDQLGIPDEMPGYDYDLSLRNGYLVVKGKVTDPNVRKLAAVSPAFPPDFTTNVELPAPVSGFKHRIRGKTVEVVLLKR
jgi:ferredoxin